MENIPILTALAFGTSSFLIGIYGLRRSINRDMLEDERMRSDRQDKAIEKVEWHLAEAQERLHGCEERERLWSEEKLRLYERLFKLEEAVRLNGGKIG